jgi:flagellin
MVINTNNAALTSARNLGESTAALNKSLARLSSGSKLVAASDNAGGAAVATRFDAQINRTQAALDNVGSAISFNQTRDGILKKVEKALDRMSELSVMALDVTKSNVDRSLYNSEFQNLGAFVTNSATRDFNGVSLFGATALNVTVTSEGATTALSGLEFWHIDLYTLGGNTLDSPVISTTTTATSALAAVKMAITQIASDRAYVGSNQVSLNMYQEQLGIVKDNLSAANSRIKDVNVGEESTQYARYNILVQAGTAMLAQANTSTQSALRLLG